MNIIGKSNKVLDADLLGKLALQHQSGSTVSKAEAKKTVDDIKTNLSNDFYDSARGLARAETAIANTIELALKSDWIHPTSAADILEKFLDGRYENSLKDTVKDLRAEIKSRQRSSGSSYGGYRRTNYGT